MEMNAQATKIQAAENDLKQLMADVTRAVEKAQQAVAKISPKAAADTSAAQMVWRLSLMSLVEDSQATAGPSTKSKLVHPNRIQISR